MTDHTPAMPAADDPLLWLEDVHGERAMAWVRAQNERSQAELTARPEYAPTRAQLLEVLNAHDRIPFVVRRGPWLYNLWQDAAHPRGLWRRTTLESYRTEAPDWEVAAVLLEGAGVVPLEAEGSWTTAWASWAWGAVVDMLGADRGCPQDGQQT